MRGRLLALGLGLVLALLLAELGLRVFAKSFHAWIPATIKAGEPYPKNLYQAHPFLPYTLRPGVNVWLNPVRKSPIGESRRFWIDHRINALGARGDEVATLKPANVVRIAALGGSTTFSVTNREEDSWPRLLAKRLAATQTGATRYEVLNFGTPKAASPYTLVLLATRVIALKPDVVIVYDGINDVSNWRFSGLGPDHSHVYADMREIPSWVESVPAWAFRSALVTFAVYRSALRSEETFGERADLRPGEMDVARGVQILLDNYRSMRGICRAHGARFVSATFHVLDESDEFGRAIVAWNDALRRWAKEEEVTIADLAGRIPHGDGSLHVDQAHFTAAGDALVAEIFEETLRERVLREIATAESRRP